MAVDLSTLGDALVAALGADQVRVGDSLLDATAGVTPRWVAQPSDAAGVARTLRLADEAGVAVAPRGGGTKRDWGNPPRRVELALDLAALTGVVEHAYGDMTATVRAGTRWRDLRLTLAEHQQYVALDPIFPERATVGGIIATNDSGPLRLRYGALRDLLIGVTVALPDGTLARAGGKVVKNVAGYDICKLMVGALGTLGVVVEATFRLYPLPRQTELLSFTLPDGRAANALILRLLDSTAGPVALQWRQSGDAAGQLDLRLDGEPAAIPEQIALVRHLAGDASAAPAEAADPWRATEALFRDDPDALVVKASVPTTRIGALSEGLRQAGREHGATVDQVIQAPGVGYARFTGGDLGAVVTRLRATVDELTGTLVALVAPAAVKARGDVWGDAGDALPLMRRVKEKFDPHGTLNPGRFIGGI